MKNISLEEEKGNKKYEQSHCIYDWYNNIFFYDLVFFFMIWAHSCFVNITQSDVLYIIGKLNISEIYENLICKKNIIKDLSIYLSFFHCRPVQASNKQMMNALLLITVTLTFIPLMTWSLCYVGDWHTKLGHCKGMFWCVGCCEGALLRLLFWLPGSP